MGKKSSAKIERKECREFVIDIKGTYSQKNGIENVEVSRLVGSGQIIASLCFGLLQDICEKSKIKYNELLSNEIKRYVYNEAIKNAEELAKKEEEQNGKR